MIPMGLVDVICFGFPGRVAEPTTIPLVRRVLPHLDRLSR